MARIVSLWLPCWPTDRLRRQLGLDAPPADAPLVLAARDGGRRVVTATDAAASRRRIRPGMALSHAQALVPGLVVHPADPVADRRALQALALAALDRFTPLVALDPPDGLLLDVTGCAHLFGGEAALLTAIAALGGDGRAALADTAGAAWAMARHGPAGIVPPREHRAALAALPVAALRLELGTVAGLQALGIERIGQLAALPRAPLVQRFGPLRRLDQALGMAPEPLAWLNPPDPVMTTLAFAEPIAAPQSLSAGITRLVAQLCAALEARQHGARRLDLLFERVDGHVQAIRIGTARPARDPKRLARLLTDRLEGIDPGFGIERMALHASRTEPMPWQQAGALGEKAACDLAALVDTLANRLGAGRIYRCAPVESDVPERSVARIPPLAPPTGATWPCHRPVRLLSRPEQIETMALLPDQPPVWFTWRGVRRRVARADGPERIFGEWWKRDAECAAVRDYFIVEDESGARFWLYRSGDGTDQATGNLAWFMHGLFS